MPEGDEVNNANQAIEQVEDGTGSQNKLRKNNSYPSAKMKTTEDLIG